ncbi:MAG: SPOR domain-containing protein [Woeseiaceae bacterium]
MARKKRKRTTRKKQQEYPGWVWMLFGLAIGLSVAFAIYRKDAIAPTATQPVAREPASMETSMAPEMVAVAEPAEEVEDSPTENRFTFYDMLPNFEVIIPEEEPDVKPDRVIEAVQQPGLYVLQAGSFTEPADADRRRAELALQGVESRVQRVSIDDKTYHRVRIGPISDLDELNRIRSQLRQAKIDVLRIRLGD